MCAGLLSGLAGCAAVTIVDADGTRDVSLQPFKVETVHRPADRPQLISITTLGISSTAQGFDVGLKTEDIVATPPSCHAVMVVRSEAQAETAATLAGLVDKSCIVQR